MVSSSYRFASLGMELNNYKNENDVVASFFLFLFLLADLGLFQSSRQPAPTAQPAVRFFFKFRFKSSLLVDG